jgi:hypothetical protein
MGALWLILARWWHFPRPLSCMLFTFRRSVAWISWTSGLLKRCISAVGMLLKQWWFLSVATDVSRQSQPVNCYVRHFLYSPLPVTFVCCVLSPHPHPSMLHLPRFNVTQNDATDMLTWNAAFIRRSMSFCKCVSTRTQCYPCHHCWTLSFFECSQAATAQAAPRDAS